MDFQLEFLFPWGRPSISVFIFSSPAVSLPWQGLKAGTKKQKYEKISERKVSTSIEVGLLYNVYRSSLCNVRFFFRLLKIKLECISRLYVGDIHQNLHHTSIIAVHFVLMTNQIMLISKGYSVTFLSVKVSSSLSHIL